MLVIKCSLLWIPCVSGGRDDDDDDDDGCLCSVCADVNECTKASAQSCGECIQAGEKCGWCTDEVSSDETIKEGNGCFCSDVHLGKNLMGETISCSQIICLSKSVEDIL